MEPRALIGEAWSLYRGHRRHLVSIAFVVYGGIAAVSALAVLLLGPFGLTAIFFLSLAGVFWLQGAVAKAVEDVRDGRADLTWSRPSSCSRRRGSYEPSAGAASSCAAVMP